MALPNSGPISIEDIVAEFGGTAPDSLSEYYGVAAGIPASGAISLEDFYGVSAATAVTIRAWGGAGGKHPDFGGADLNGKGTECQWIGSVTPGSSMQIAVGGVGQDAPNPYGTGGGAGSAVYINNSLLSNPIVISGGGGGGGTNYNGFAGRGGSAPSGPGNGGRSSGGSVNAEPYGGTSAGGGGAGGTGRANGQPGKSHTNNGSGGVGSPAMQVHVPGDAGIGASLKGGGGSYSEGNGAGAGGGGGYGGGGGGPVAGVCSGAAAGSSQVFSQAGFALESSAGGSSNDSGGLVQVIIGGATVKQVNVGKSSAGSTGSYTI